jgi:predicted aspartyl protease
MTKREETTLPTIRAWVRTNRNADEQATILLDTGATINLISKGFFEKLNLPKDESIKYNIVGYDGSTKQATLGLAKVTLVDKQKEVKIPIDVHIVNNLLTALAMTQTEQICMMEREGKLADPAVCREREVEIILGCTDVIKIIAQKKKGINEPENIKTIFGAVVAATRHLKNNGETTDKKGLREKNDKIAIEQFKRETTRDNQGRIVTSMPYTGKLTELGNTLPLATQRLKMMEKRMNGDKILRDKYHEFMENYERDGHMVAIKGDPY